MPVAGNIFADIPERLDAELFETLAGNAACRLERIVSRGHSTPAGEWYDQEWDEWVVLLRGSATLRFAGDRQPVALSPGDYLLIPAHCRHRVEATSWDEDTVWLALHFAA
jgi:cupin 2 domain-containing protein